MIENARYTENGSILALFDGVDMSVPNDMANRHRQELAEWEALGNIIEPVLVPTFEEQRAAKLATLAAKRWEIETGGIVVGGFPVLTDDRSKLLITGARVKADADPAFTTKWVAADGTRSTIAAAAIIAMSNAVLSHVDACFDRFDLLATAIAAAGNEAVLDAIDINTGWPPNA